MKKFLTKPRQGKMGLVAGIIGGVIGIVVLAKVAVAMWPTFVGTGTDVAALTQTDAGTETLQAIWPIVIVVVGIGIAAGAIFWALRKFGVMS